LKKWFFLTALLVWIVGNAVAQTSVTVTVDKIWDNDTHAAFTSLMKFKGKYYCCFREGYSHIFDAEGKAEGHIRILQSADGKTWNAVADMGMEGIDLRDPQLSETPDGRLMVSMGGSIYRERKLTGTKPIVCFQVVVTPAIPAC